MEISDVFISTPPEPATRLRTSEEIGEGEAGYLARIAYLHIRHRQFPDARGKRRMHCRTQAQSSGVGDPPRGHFRVSMGHIYAAVATSISRADTFVGPAELFKDTSNFSLFPGRIGSISAGSPLDWGSISGAARTTLVCHQPCVPLVRQYSALWIHLSSSHGRWPLRADPT